MGICLFFAIPVFPLILAKRDQPLACIKMSCFFLDELQGTVCLGQSEREVGAGVSQRGSQTCWSLSPRVSSSAAWVSGCGPAFGSVLREKWGLWLQVGLGWHQIMESCSSALQPRKGPAGPSQGWFVASSETRRTSKEAHIHSASSDTYSWAEIPRVRRFGATEVLQLYRCPAFSHCPPLAGMVRGSASPNSFLFLAKEKKKTTRRGKN